jgi:hypothetical protein
MNWFLGAFATIDQRMGTKLFLERCSAASILQPTLRAFIDATKTKNEHHEQHLHRSPETG